MKNKSKTKLSILRNLLIAPYLLLLILTVSCSDDHIDDSETI